MNTPHLNFLIGLMEEASRLVDSNPTDSVSRDYALARLAAIEAEVDAEYEAMKMGAQAS
jgi:hypothetical protein